jgi:hypothetical protein
MKRAKRRVTILATVVLAVALLWLVILVLPSRIVRLSVGDAGVGKLGPDQRLKAENDVRTTLLQGLGGAALLTGAFLTWRQLGVTREGQITDRYTKAIDQLGSDETDVRIGGIYALERVAKDSTADRSTITAVLCTFVREHASVHDGDEEAPPPRADVQAALTVLGQIGAPSRSIDLSGTGLRKAMLKHSDFEGAEFTGADLRQAWLLNARLRGARFRWADLRGAFLKDADLRDTLLGAEASEAGAHLEKSELYGADLRGAALRGAHLAGARADARTRWPEGFSREALLQAGVVLED